MIPVRRSPTPLNQEGSLPLLHRAAQDVPSGGVYVAKTEGNTLRPQLEDGKRVVLESASDKNQRAELITCGGNGPIAAGVIGADGTYLNAVDYAKFTNRDNLTLRLYTFSDTLGKIVSSAGLVVLLPAIGALLIAVVGIFFLLSSQGQPSASAAVGTAPTVLAWAGQPAVQLDAAKVSDAQVAQVHQQLDTRSREAEWCLQAIEGQQAPAVAIPGVTCAPVSVPWWRRTLTGSLITGGIAVLTGLVGILALRSRYGFQKSPAS
jgi:hypothetical protein